MKTLTNLGWTVDHTHICLEGKPYGHEWRCPPGCLAGSYLTCPEHDNRKKEEDK